MSPPPPRSTLFPYTTLFRSFERDLAAQGVVDVSGLRQNELWLEYRFGHSLWDLPQAHHQSQHVIIERFAAHLGWTGCCGGSGFRLRARALAARRRRATHTAFLVAQPRRPLFGVRSLFPSV